MELASLPELYAGRYLSEGVAERVGRGELVPVRMSAGPSIIPLPYEVEEVAWSLVPGDDAWASRWDWLTVNYMKQLSSVGVERIAGELREISERHGGLPLALLDDDHLLEEVESPRAIFALWWEHATGEPVLELLDSGETLRTEELPKQVRPVLPGPPKKKEDDRRFAHDEHIAPWPLSHDDFAAWVASRHWQFAKTSPKNPHEYTRADWGSEEMFRLAALHIREFGYVQTYAKRQYVAYDCGEHFYWTMNAPLPITWIVNRKLHDPEAQACLAEEKTGKSRQELGLRLPVSNAVEGGDQVRDHGDRAVQPKLSDIDTKEEA